MGTGIVGMQGFAQGVVICGLINKALTPSVYQDSTRPSTLIRTQQIIGLGIPMLGLKLQHALHPISMLHVAQLGTRIDRHQQAITLILGHAHRSGKRPTQKGLNQLFIPLKTTCGNDHAAPSAHTIVLTIFVFSDHTDNAIAVFNQPSCALLEFNRNFPVEYGFEQRTGQRLPQAPVIPLFTLSQCCLV